MGRRNYDNEKQNEEIKTGKILGIVAGIILVLSIVMVYFLSSV